MGYHFFGTIESSKDSFKSDAQFEIYFADVRISKFITSYISEHSEYASEYYKNGLNITEKTSKILFDSDAFYIFSEEALSKMIICCDKLDIENEWNPGNAGIGFTLVSDTIGLLKKYSDPDRQYRFVLQYI